MMHLDPQLLEEAGDILRSDPDLHDLALTEGIEFAGMSLNIKVEPEVDNAAELPYWHRVKAELRTLLCTNNTKYAELRKRMAQTRSAGERVGVPTIAVAIGEAVGLEAGLITPFVAMLLVMVGQISLGAWCAGAGDDDRRKLSPE